MMQMGGNARLKEHFMKYDLMAEDEYNLKSRYKTKASKYYRDKLKAQLHKKAFNVEEPKYDEGRLEAPCYKLKQLRNMKLKTT